MITFTWTLSTFKNFQGKTSTEWQWSDGYWPSRIIPLDWWQSLQFQGMAKHVAYELEKYLSLVNSPTIFHTDNGNKLTARVIFNILKSINPSILTVSGRPRMSQDQGSIEQTNQWIRCCQTYLQIGTNPDWMAIAGQWCLECQLQIWTPSMDKRQAPSLYTMQCLEPIITSQHHALWVRPISARPCMN